MVAKKNSRSKARKATRAKAAKKTAVRSGRKAPGRLVQTVSPSEVFNIT